MKNEKYKLKLISNQINNDNLDQSIGTTSSNNNSTRNFNNNNNSDFRFIVENHSYFTHA